jgi:MAC/Perforin domain
MTKPPDQPPPRPLNVKQYSPVLEAPDIPSFQAAMDHTAGVTGFGAGTVAEHRDLLSELNEEDQFRLLQANNIRPVATTGADAKPLWEMTAFVVGRDLVPARKGSVRFRKLKMLTPEKGSIDHVGYSYKEFESNIQRQMATTSELEFGIPGVFKVNTSYSEASATATQEKTVTIYSEASHLIPKATIAIDDDQITLDPEFVSKLEKMTGTKQQRTDRLLELLREYGQFVCVNMMLGGRLTFHTKTALSDKSEFETVKRQFKAAADARFTVEGVPAEVGGGTGVGTGGTTTTHTVIQAKSLHMELQGGDENLASSKEGELGRAWKPGQTAPTWVASLGRYREWRVVGFYEHSMLPIIDFLKSPTLRDQCMDLLRDYFVSQLSIRHSDTAGHEHGKDLAQDSGAPAPNTVKRISEIDLRHGGCLDALRLTYEVYTDGGKNTKTVTTKWVGSTDAGKPVNIKLKDGEELAAIETWTDPTRDGWPGGLLQQVAFVTNTKRRFPNDTGFYGENKGRKKDVFKTIEAPRVRGIDGSNGAYVHRIGLAYAALDGNAKSREFLLAMEPFLFPEGVYGMIPA